MVFGKLFSKAGGGQEDSLRRAAGEGDEQHLSKLLKAGVAPDPKKEHHTSALQLAAKLGRLECVKALVEAGAGVNRVADGSPLLEAAAYGHVDVVKYLLDKKADPSKAWKGNTALHMAARFGHHKIIELLEPLVDMKVAVAAGNGEGKTPLMLTCCMQEGGEAAATLLLDAGSNAAAVDLAGNTSLHHAATSGNAAIAKLLLNSGPRGRQCQGMVNGMGRTPLHLAAVFGRKAVVELLAQHKQADLKAKDKEGSTVLHMLAKSVMCDGASVRVMAQVVVEAGVDPEAADDAGHTAAFYATPTLKKLLASVAPSKPGALVAPAAPESPELATSSSGAAQAQPAAAAPTSKAEKIASAVAGAVAGLESEGGADPADPDSRRASWVFKEAMRRRSSEEVEGGWTLKAAVGEQEVTAACEN